MKIMQKINTLWGGVAALCAATFGKYWVLFAAFFVLNAIDYITGILKARYTRTENSGKGLKGIIKKFGYWICIAISFFMALEFKEMGDILGIELGFVMFMGWFTLATFIINEIRSILENLVLLGVEVPLFLVKGLEVCAMAVDKTAKSKWEADENDG